MLIVARDIAGASSAGTVAVQCSMHLHKYLRVPALAKIIIRAPHSHSFVGSRHMGARKFAGEAIDIVEITIRFIFMLFLQLRIVEGLVIKQVRGSDGSIRFGARERSFAVQCRKIPCIRLGERRMD